MSIADMGNSISYFLGAMYNDAGKSKTLCNLAGALMQMSEASSVFWCALARRSRNGVPHRALRACARRTGCIALNIYLVLIRRISLDTFKKLETGYIVFSFGARVARDEGVPLTAPH